MGRRDGYGCPVLTGCRHCNHDGNQGEGEQDFSVLEVCLLPDAAGGHDFRKSYNCTLKVISVLLMTNNKN